MNIHIFKGENTSKRKELMGREQWKSKEVKQLISSLQNAPRWNLSSGKHSSDHLEAIFNSLHNPSNLNFLWLHCNRIEAICKLVVLPNYAQIKIMNLGGNNIVSVEPLVHAKMQTLEQLWLWSNQLTRVDILRKMYVPNLKFLDLSCNFIVEWPKFSEMFSRHLEIISIQKNLFGNINGFIKNISGDSNCLMNIFENQLVTVFGKVVKMKKKRAKLFNFEKKEIEYV